MVTTVGTEHRLDDLLTDLVQLDHDAAAAYQAAIERLENADFKAKLGEFRADHVRHIQELGQCLSDMGKAAPTEGDVKQVLTKGKVVIAGLIGDKAILTAMRSNEEDTVTAYSRAAEFRDAPSTVHALLDANRQDELRHRAWLASTIEAMR